MSDLQTQLRSYGQLLDSQATPLAELTPKGQRLVPAPVGWRGPLIALGTAAAVVISVVAVVFLLGAPEARDPVAPPIQPTVTSPLTPTTDAFTWDVEDLSEWVTEEEMTIALRDVVSRYAGTTVDGVARFDQEVVDAGGGAGLWEMGGWSVQVHNGDHNGNYVGPPSETDARLPQGVAFDREEGFGWGHYIFSGPKSDEMISVWLRPPGTSFGYPAGSEIWTHEAMLFPLASWMLQEMGWVDPPTDPLPASAKDLEPVPMMGMEQILYGAGDIGCPEHWAHDQSLPLGTVEFEAGQGTLTVVVELTAAAPDSDYRVEVWEPETCLGGPLLFHPVGILTTGETGAGRTEFTVGDVDPGTYRLNVNLAHTDWEDRFPDADDTRLWEIGGAGFSLLEILPVP